MSITRLPEAPSVPVRAALPAIGTARRGDVVHVGDKAYEHTGRFWRPIHQTFTPETVMRREYANEFLDPRATRTADFEKDIGTFTLITNDAPAGTAEVPAAPTPTSITNVFTPTATVHYPVQASNTGSPRGQAIKEGQTIHVRAAGKLVVGNATTDIYCYLYYYDSAGAALTGNSLNRRVGYKSDAAVGTWYQFEGFDTAPKNAAFAKIVFLVDGVTVSSSTEFRGTNFHFVVEPDSDVSEFVSGDITGIKPGTWLGTANNSRSKRSLDVGTPDPTVQWGFNDHAAADGLIPAAADAQLCAEVGANCTRLGFVPGKVAASQAVYNQGPAAWDWSFYDDLFGEFAKLGIKVYMIAGSGDESYWMTPSVSQATFNAGVYPPDAGSPGRVEYARIVAEACIRYREHITAVEVWNEPNESIFWTPGPNATNYVALLSAIFTEVNLLTPEVPVAGPSTSTRASGGAPSIAFNTFLTDCYTAGLKDVTDAISYHAYSPLLGVGSDVAPSGSYVNFNKGPDEILDTVKSIMATNTDSAKPLHCTETGWSTGGGPRQDVPLSEHTHARLVTLLRGWLVRKGVKTIHIHTLVRDPTTVDAYNKGFECVEGPGLRPKPVFYLLRHDWATTPQTRHEALKHPLVLRSSWMPSKAVAETFSRLDQTATWIPPTAATCRLCGGMVVPAGPVVRAVNIYSTAAGATYTIKWFAYVRQSDRSVLGVTANSTAVLAVGNWNRIVLSAPFAVIDDTPVWVAVAIAATTAPTLAASAAMTAALVSFQDPVMHGNTTTPTSTPPAVGTVLAAPTGGQTQGVYCYAD